MCETATVARQAGSHPRWAALYAVTLPGLTALAVVEIVSVPDILRAVGRCILVLATFVGMAWWLRGSRAAFDLEEWCECAPRTITVRVIESHRPEPVPRLEPPVPVTAEADELVHA
jgi:hypothetical protein